MPTANFLKKKKKELNEIKNSQKYIFNKSTNYKTKMYLVILIVKPYDIIENYNYKL